MRRWWTEVIEGGARRRRRRQRAQAAWREGFAAGVGLTDDQPPWTAPAGGPPGSGQAPADEQRG